MNSTDTAYTRTLRGLITQYGAFSVGQGLTAQRRGWRFESLVADVLRYCGVDAGADVRGSGGRDQIDVVFATGGARFVLEAKWHATPVSADPIAKLFDRLRSRAAGTCGVVLSMSGYTKAAIDEANHNKWPNILLLDRPHFEAMLCGLVPPADLLGAILDRASYRGGTYASLTDLLVPRRPAPPTFATVPQARVPWQVVRDTAAGVTAQVMLVGDAGWEAPSGMAAGRGRRLLVTIPDGIVEVDPDDGSTGWALPLAGCRGTPAVAPDGGILAVCSHAVVRWRDATLKVVAGGFTGNSGLLPGPDGQPWVFDNTGARYDGLLTLTRLGARPGEEQRHQIDFPAEVWNAAWLDGRRFFLSASGHGAVVDLDTGSSVDRAAWIESPHPWPQGVLAVDGATVVTASPDGSGVRGTVCRTRLETQSSERIADLAVNRTGDLATAGDGRTYLLADIRGNSPNPRPLLIQLGGHDHPSLIRHVSLEIQRGDDQ